MWTGVEGNKRIARDGSAIFASVDAYIWEITAVLLCRAKDAGCDHQAGPDGCWDRCHGCADGPCYSCQAGHHWCGQQVSGTGLEEKSKLELAWGTAGNL